MYPKVCVISSKTSQFHGVGGSEMFEDIEAVDDCSAFAVECCYVVDG